MIKLGIRKVKPEEESRLREWMSQLNSRHPEVRETFRQEGVTHVDHGRAGAAFAQSTLPIDVEHKRIMSQVLGAIVPSELLFECHA